MKFKRIYVEITNRCNLSCSFCSKSNRPLREMELSEFSHVVEEIRQVTDNIYLHIKGEPLLYSKLDEILTICDKNQIKVNITTNGTLIDRKISILIGHDSLSHINFSLHSENHDPNYLEKIFTAVEKLSPKTVIIYRFWTLQNGKLDKKTKDIVEKMREHYNLSTEIVEKIENEKNIKIAPNTYVDKDELFTWPSLEEEKELKGYCFGGKSHIGILSDGTVVPCCLDGEGEISLGNIFEQSLSEILESKRYQDLIQGFRDRKPTETLCKKCTYKERF